MRNVPAYCHAHEYQWHKAMPYNYTDSALRANLFCGFRVTRTLQKPFDKLEKLVEERFTCGFLSIVLLLSAVLVYSKFMYKKASTPFQQTGAESPNRPVLRKSLTVLSQEKQSDHADEA